MNNVRDAECCKHCKNTGDEFTFNDSILCYKTNKYRMHTETCDIFERKEKEQ